MKKEELASSEVYFFVGVDENGNPVSRPKSQYPYSYDGFVQHRMGDNSEISDTVYSDRLRQWDYEKHKALMAKHFGESCDYFSHRAPSKVESFLREYLDLPKLKLILVMEYCNRSNGYPYWRFDYKKNA